MLNYLLTFKCSPRKQMEKDGSISTHLYHRIRPSASQPSRLYGLLKVHKDNVALHLIVSFIISPTYELSKHVGYVLSHLVEKIDSFVKTSKDFCCFIKDQRIKQG